MSINRAISIDRARRPSQRPHVEYPTTRREFLVRAGGGFGALALAGMLDTRTAQAVESTEPAATWHGGMRRRARSVIFLFMEGGPSHIDMFDPKPTLNQLAGQQLPESFGPIITAMGETDAPLLASQRSWQQYGESGLWVSDWLPHTARHADDLCVIRSCWADGLNHVGSVCQMNTGSVHAGRPSLGSWTMYGLGSENDDLPGFVVLTDGKKTPLGGKRNWGTGFMPATYQGVRFGDGDNPIPHLATSLDVSSERQLRKRELLAELNRRHAEPRGHQSELDARIAAFELAFRMQSECPEAVDISRETAATRAMYGLDDEKTAATGRNCLLARRLVERGVRFVQVYCGAGSRWDAHTKLEANHGGLCRESDQPVAALLADLKQRGLLEETLVVWGGEFGRTPMSEKGDGRDHNPFGFTMWMAGGGVRGGQTIGTTDELGLRAVEDRVHVHDLHATILAAMGVDHMKLIYTSGGRHENPTINDGRIVDKVFTT
ncbi:MAG: DUF1501 domain-containing protein [Planctomycetales bacterium]|nr:DUF1501 domain-containing protein [Planctomycetales bacterium]